MAIKTKSKDLTVRFMMDTSNFDKKQKQVKKGLDGLDDSNIKTKKSFVGMGDAAQGLMGRLGPLAMKIGLIVGAFFALKKAIDPILKAGEDAEGSITTLTVLLGSEAKAILAFNNAVKMSQKTPFSPQEVASATALAAQFGVKDAFGKTLVGADNVKLSVMDIVAGMASFRDMQGQFMGMQRAASGLLRGELAMLDNYRGLVMPAYKAAAKQAQVGTPKFVKEFVKGVAQISQITNMAKAQAESYSGVISTIKGHIGLVFLHISGAALGTRAETFWTKLREGAKGFSDNLGKFVSDSAPVLREIGNFLASIFRVIGAALKALYVVFKPFIVLIGATFVILMKVLTPLFNAITWLLDALSKETSIMWEMADVFYGISHDMKVMFEFVDNMFIKVQMMGVFLRKTWDAMGQSLKDFLTDIPGSIIKTTKDLTSNFPRAVIEATTGNFQPLEQHVLRDMPSSPLGALFETVRGALVGPSSNTTNNSD
ncbi:MAG: hypothetical protein KAS32_02650, partial [Candidatus Peribacteraceae bacterium]|nr:hypothetical protein [Candidatus Peribacteraceae bacterium]